MSSVQEFNESAHRCFANVIILDKILHHVSDHPMSMLELRLVNKACNQEILHQIRRTHREIKIESYWGYRTITINDHVLNAGMVRKRFEFLTEVANVRVEKLELEDLWDFLTQPAIRQPLHDAIIQVLLKNQTPRVLIGMYGVCEDGCSECIRHALGCQEYGPMQFEALKAFKNQKIHFKRLIVLEAGLRDITSHCRKNSESREQCLEMMKDLVNGNLTCDHLQLSLEDNPCYSPYIWLLNGPKLPQLFPLELIVEMCTIWRPKTVGIDLQDCGRENLCFSNTEDKSFFTTFQFDWPYEQTPRSTGFLLDHVEIDLEFSSYSDMGVFGYELPLAIDNFLPNIRRLFPAKHYYVNNYRWMTESSLSGANRYKISSLGVEKIIDVAFKGTNPNDCDAPITCRYYTLVNDVSMLCEIPKTPWIGNRRFTTTVLPSTITDWFVCGELNQSKTLREDLHLERVAKTFRITDSVSGSVLDLEIYVEKKSVVLGKHGGFLQHYNNL